MYNVPDNLRYTKTHEWIRSEGDVVVIGITDFAQHQMTDIVYVDFPSEGAAKKAGEPLLTIESVKSAEDVFSPVSGKVVEINQAVTSKPELLNQDPYVNWLVKIRADAGSKTSSLSPSEYKELTAEK